MRERDALLYSEIEKGDVILSPSADRFSKYSDGAVVELGRDRTSKGLAGLVP